MLPFFPSAVISLDLFMSITSSVVLLNKAKKGGTKKKVSQGRQRRSSRFGVRKREEGVESVRR